MCHNGITGKSTHTLNVDFSDMMFLNKQLFGTFLVIRWIQRSILSGILFF